MVSDQDEIIAEAVRKYPVLYDKSDRFFKDRAKKQLAWKDVAKEANLCNGRSSLSISTLVIQLLLEKIVIS